MNTVVIISQVGGCKVVGITKTETWIYNPLGNTSKCISRTVHRTNPEFFDQQEVGGKVVLERGSHTVLVIKVGLNFIFSETLNTIPPAR